VELHVTLLEIAKKDLEASKHLLSKKLYPQSIFYLEQSVEKAVKSLGVWTKTITEKEMKEKYISHKAYAVFSHILKKGPGKIWEELKKFDKLFERYPKLYEWIRNELDEAKEMEEEIQSIPIDKIIDMSYSAEKLQTIINRININREKVLNKILRFCLKVGILVPPLKEDLRSIQKMLLLSTPYFFIPPLFYLSIILYPHAVKSRYPEKEWNPLEEYNEKMALIQKLPSIIKVLDKAFKSLTQVYKEIPSPYPSSFTIRIRGETT